MRTDTAPGLPAVLSRLTGTIPPAQLLRYLLVGGWNTAFGYTCFFFINRWMAHLMPQYSYIAANLLAYLIAVTVSFLGYKWFVFRTRGNYLRELLKTFTVYIGSILISTLALPPLVGILSHATPYRTQAPYIAAAIVSIFNVLGSYLGHRHFSFRKPSQDLRPLQSSPSRIK